jgi:DNA ligase-1
MFRLTLYRLIFLFVCGCFLPTITNAAQPAQSDGEALRQPGLLLAKVYEEGIKLEDYWVSEKLDGVRAYWDGTQLISRHGNVFNAPEWFIQAFPSVPLDGELWMKRNTFEELSAAVRRQKPKVEEWQRIRYMVFDLPGSSETFDHRLKVLEQLILEVKSPYLQRVEQFRVTNHQALMEKLEEIVMQGGEGLILHRGDSQYRSGRFDDLLKFKPYMDAEAVVIEHLPGKGKFEGMMGAILVENEEGKRFGIGTGFSDNERQNPPPIGSVITYKYHGLTRNGVPRFASFLRLHKNY